MKTNHKAVWLVVLIAQIIPAIWYGLFVDAYPKENPFLSIGAILLTRLGSEASKKLKPIK